MLAVMRDYERSKRLKCCKTEGFFFELLIKTRRFPPRDFWASTGFGVSVKEEVQRMLVAQIL